VPAHPKKHHFVPQFLLERFSGPGGKLLVHKYMADRQFTSNVTDVGHRNHGHTLYWPGKEPDHVSLESAMASIEGEAATAISELSVSRRREVPAELREPLAWLMALQYQRSRFLMHMIGNEVAATDSSDGWSAEQLQTSFLSLIRMHVLSPWNIRNDPYERPKDRWNPVVAFLLAGDSYWSCYRPPSTS